MIQLGSFPNMYPRLQLGACGLLFLSTPHSGTTQADWNGPLLALAEYSFGLRARDVISKLQSSGDYSVASKEMFGNLKPVPLVCCLVEGKKTRVLGTDCLVSDFDLILNLKNK
jgi:hypothetical protein